MQLRKCEQFVNFQFYKLSHYECEGKNLIFFFILLFKSHALLNLNMYSQTDVDNNINNILSTLKVLNMFTVRMSIRAHK